jgi:ATP-binding cassette subfamily B multidrug efflux pump
VRTDYGYAEERRLGRPYDLKLLARLVPFVRPYSRMLAVAVALVLAITVLELALPYVTKVAVDRYIVPRAVPGAPVLEMAERMVGIGWTTALFLFLVAANFTATFFQVQLMEAIGQRAMHALRLDLVRHILDLPVAFFDRQPVGRLVTRATNDTQNLHELATSVVAFVFKDLFLMAGIAAVLVWLDLRLALISFAVLPLVMAAAWHFARRSRDVFRRLTVRLAELNTRFAETIGGISVIQLMGREAANARAFEALNDDYYRLGMTQIHIFAVFLPVIEVLGAAALAVVVYYGGGAVVAERISLGALVAYISYMRMFFRPIRDIAEKYNIMQNAMASAERIIAIRDEEAADAPVDPSRPAPAAPPEPAQMLVLEGVAFGYGTDAPVLDGLSLTVSRNQTLAIVGPTGAGKTSLIHLLLRFYDPQQGSIFLDGRDVRTIAPSELRRHIALVSQDPFLFSTTLEANIFPAGLPEPRVVARVLEAAQCADLVARLPQGLDTRIGEGGRTLSSGERQLVAIARALARNPALIIFDEATAHVDSATEARIQKALDQLTHQRTAIVIAHRISTARAADRIAVLRRGRIAEYGSHEELMARRGYYHQLNQQQV